MTKKANKSAAAGGERWPGKYLRDKVQSAARGEPVAGQRVEVTFVVEGGAPGERFFESVAVDSDGNVRYEVEDRLRRMRRRKRTGQVSPKLLKPVFAEVRDIGRTDYRPFAEPILPDTLVGLLRVRSGKREDETYFPMEEEAELTGERSITRLKLHSGKELGVQRRAIPKRFVKAAESLSRVPDLVD